MKKILFTSLAVLGLGITGCSNEDLGVAKSGVDEVCATMGDAESRTAMNGNSVVWSIGDEIGIFVTNGSSSTYTNINYSLSSGAGTKNAGFSGVLEGESPVKKAAFYPYGSDASYDGSKISLTNDNQKTTLAQVNNGSLTLNGGTYETISNGIGTDADPNGSIVVGATGTLTVADAKIIANDTDGGTIAGILVEEGGSVVVSDSDIEATSHDGLKSDGIRNFGTMTLTNTKVVGYANYTANAQKTDYATSTRGINNEGTMTLKNCELYGTHSGIRSTGTLYIDGGTYEGYGHGGIYFAGANTTSYVKNAYIGICEMRNGYDDGIAGTNKAGFYIGGASNITVYMDNCELWGTWYPLVMRISSTENDNSLYISNTTLKEGFERYIRIGTDKNIKIYIGSGNNFNAEDHVYYSSNAEETNTDYSTQFPEY